MEVASCDVRIDIPLKSPTSPFPPPSWWWGISWTISKWQRPSWGRGAVLCSAPESHAIFRYWSMQDCSRHTNDTASICTFMSSTVTLCTGMALYTNSSEGSFLKYTSCSKKNNNNNARLGYFNSKIVEISVLKKLPSLVVLATQASTKIILILPILSERSTYMNILLPILSAWGACTNMLCLQVLCTEDHTCYERWVTLESNSEYNPHLGQYRYI